MEKTVALFIGGPLDGKMIDVQPHRDSVEVAITHPLGKHKMTDIFYYKKEVIECPTIDIPVFVPRDYNCSDVMAALIESYHENASE